MSKFEDFSEIYEPLVLPVNGKSYTIRPVVGAEGEKFNAAIAGGDNAPEFSDVDLEAMLLGPELKQRLLDDGVSDAAIKRILLTALAEFQGGRAMAEIMWATGGETAAMADYVKSHAPNRAARRAAPKQK
ncbi:DUF7426 family protein [Pseudolysinimonas sp.]|uniref:DUF7426 family protein n=1 Tax=Pseudolysinimonas sp. TaxID=2680009 RepID=UPI003F8229CC